MDGSDSLIVKTHILFLTYLKISFKYLHYRKIVRIFAAKIKTLKYNNYDGLEQI